MVNNVKRKALPKRIREQLYDEFNGRCAYCGSEIAYKDMQVDHVESWHWHGEVVGNMNTEELNSINNLLPACRACNFYKGQLSIEEFREHLSGVMMDNLRKNFNYRLAVKHGLVKETNQPIKFYFEERKERKQMGKLNNNVAKTVCFTGPRPAKLAGYEDRCYEDVVDELANVVLDIAKEGYNTFLTGGAQGFDQLAFQAVERAKTNSKKQLFNVVVIPFYGQEAIWKNEGVFGKQSYGRMLCQADEVVFLRGPIGGGKENYNSIKEALLDRSKYMVDHARVCIGLCNDRSERGGTQQCLKYAEQKGLDVRVVGYCCDEDGVLKLKREQ